MALRLYDTLTKEKRAFAPLDPHNVRMYVCGPTVYDFAHIGNARPVIVFDVLFRLLRHLYGADHVKYVRNITDVDDKINDRAARDYPGLPLNEAIRRVTEQTEKQFHDDVDALGCLRPTVEPRATEHIGEMRTIIDRLVEGGFAYVAADHVLFSPAAMNAANGVLPRYGALANRSLDEMIAGARVDVAPYKRDVTDFVLWKPSKPGEPSWPSPAGLTTEGRPGWHIECSAMSWKHLGETFDIHGGGIDLVFPHHENEVAQSCCAFHTDRMAQTWMHNGFLQVEGEKMSKSLGNFVTIRELLRSWNGRAWSGSAIRLGMMSTHYRQPLNWTLERISEAEKELFVIADVYSSVWAEVFKNEFSPFADWLADADESVDSDFIDCLCDDLNTHSALSVLRSRFSSAQRNEKTAGVLLASLELLGILDRKTLLLNASPILRGFYDPEAIQGGFLLGRKLQIGMLNKDEVVINEALSEFREWGVEPKLAPGSQLLLVRDDNKANSQRHQIESLIDARTAARARKDFKESDRIRDELAAMGVVLKDGKDADGKPVTTWEIAR